MNKLFDSYLDTIKQNAQKLIESVKDTTRAFELIGEETNKANNEKEDLIKYTTNFDLRFLEHLSEAANSKKPAKFICESILFLRGSIIKCTHCT